MKSDKALALGLLVASCVNEFSWQLLPVDAQGAWSYVTAWPVVAMLCLLTASGWSDSPAIVAVCAAVAIQTLPTAACSALWLIFRRHISAGEDSCSAYAGNSALLLSGLVALVILWRWPRHG